MRKGRMAIGLGAACFAGYVFYALAGAEPVKVEASRLEHHGELVFVTGELKNTGARTGPIEVEVRYYDRGGKALGKDTVSIAAIGPGAAAEFKSPPRQLDGVSDFSIYLTHGRNPYGN